MSHTPSRATTPRSANRRRMLKDAWIAIRGHHSVFPCCERDLSDSGAKITIENAVAMPQSFHLVIEVAGVEADCEVVWRKPKELGVRFSAPPKAVPPLRAQVLSQATGPAAKPSLRKRPLTSAE